MKLEATVILPVGDQGPTLLRAAESVLSQTVDNFELFLLGDRIADETRQIVARLVDEDERVRFFDHSGGKRREKTSPHEALKQARGEIVCYLEDGDLWLPHHVESMRELLKRADLAHALPLCVEPSGIIKVWPTDWTAAEDRASLLGGRDCVPVSCGAHTLAVYRKLSDGRKTLPSSTGKGWDLWQPFLGDADCRLASGSRPTVLHFPAAPRSDWTISQRLVELDAWAANLNDAAWQEEFLLEVLDTVVRDRAASEAKPAGASRPTTERVDPAHTSLNAWLRARIRRVPLVGRALGA